MVDFTKSLSQSNPIFGKCVYKTNAINLAMHGYTTPLQAIYIKEEENGEILNVSYEEEHVKLKYFVNDLIIAIKNLDNKIVQDSKGQRRAFMFVTVPSNRYLRALKNSDQFGEFIINNEVGVYMTSSPINHKDPNGDKDYAGGGYVKKAKNNYWEPKHFKIEEFIDILNNTNNVQIGLTTEEVNNHINVLVNIDQCNTGVNLPGLNGVYFGRYFDENNPLVVQIPGRICRPDNMDLGIIGDENTSAYSKKCNYVKPFGYIYIPVGLLTMEELENTKRIMEVLYHNNALKRVTMETIPKGFGDNIEPNNSDKEPEVEEIPFEHKKAPNWNTLFECTDLLKNVLFGNIIDFKNKITHKIIRAEYDIKMKIKSEMEEFFKDKPITSHNLEQFYNSIKHYPVIM